MGMTPTEIDKLEAGPELDALVAEKVMGQDGRIVETSHGDQRYFGIRSGTGLHRSFSPSTDIAAAWQVVEKLNQSFVYFDICSANPKIKNKWLCILHNEDQDHNPVLICEARAKTAPLAICRAALKAVS